MNYDQYHLICSFNDYQKSINSDQGVLMSEEGVCLALSLCYLHDRLSQQQKLSPVDEGQFEKILATLASPEQLKRFYRNIDILKKVRLRQLNQLPDHSNLFELKQLAHTEKKLNQEFHKAAMIDTLLLLHSSSNFSDNNQDFFAFDFHSSLSPSLLSSAELQTIDCLGISYDIENINSIFDIRNSLSPFLPGGHYLLCLSDHAIAVSVSSEGILELYDPNLGLPLKTLTSSEYNFIAKHYSTNKKVNIVIYAVDFIKKFNDHKILHNNCRKRFSEIFQNWISPYREMSLEKLFDHCIIPMSMFRPHDDAEDFFLEKISSANKNELKKILSYRFEGKNILHHAIIAAHRIDHIAFLKNLVEKIEPRFDRSYSSFSAVDLLVLLNRFEYIKLFLDHSIQPQFLSSEARSLIEKRAQAGDLDCLKALLPYMNNKILFTEDQTYPFVYAYEHQDQLISKELIALAPSIDKKIELFKAIDRADYKEVQDFLNDLSFDINDSSSGCLPLNYALQSGDHLIIKFFLESERVTLSDHNRQISLADFFILEDDLCSLILLFEQSRYKPKITVASMDKLHENLMEGNTHLAKFLLKIDTKIISCLLNDKPLLASWEFIRNILSPSINDCRKDFFYEPLAKAILKDDAELTLKLCAYPGVSLVASDVHGVPLFVHALLSNNHLIIKAFFSDPSVQYAAINDKNFFDAFLKIYQGGSKSDAYIVNFMLNLLPISLKNIIKHLRKKFPQEFIEKSLSSAIYQEFFERMMIRSPEYIEVILSLTLETLLDLMDEPTDSYPEKYKNALLMIKVLQLYKHLHPTLGLPQTLSRILKQIEEEPLNSINQLLTKMKKFLEKNEIKISHHQVLTLKKRDDQQKSEQSNHAPFSYVVNLIPSFWNQFSWSDN